MTARKHSVDEVLKSFKNKRDLRVIGSTIYILKNTILNSKGERIPNPQSVGDIGNGTNGKIDYLVNYCGYSSIYVAKF